MATLQIAAAFVESNEARKRASFGGVRGFHVRKTSRVSCQKSSAEGPRSGSESDGDMETVNIFQSSRNPLLNLPREDLIAALAEKGDNSEGVVIPEASGARPRSRVRVVKFTAEKARLLRKENRATQTFHDSWFHSAIASKLAMPED